MKINIDTIAEYIHFDQIIFDILILFSSFFLLKPIFSNENIIPHYISNSGINIFFFLFFIFTIMFYIAYWKKYEDYVIDWLMFLLLFLFFAFVIVKLSQSPYIIARIYSMKYTVVSEQLIGWAMIGIIFGFLLGGSSNKFVHFHQFIIRDSFYYSFSSSALKYLIIFISISLLLIQELLYLKFLQIKMEEPTFIKFNLFMPLSGVGFIRFMLMFRPYVKKLNIFLGVIVIIIHIIRINSTFLR